MQTKCDHCGGPVNLRQRRPDNRYWCQAPECRRLFRNQKQREFNAKNPGYYARFARKNRVRYREQIAAGERQTQRQRYPETHKAADQRRRARKMGAECETFTTLEVCERDGWVCGICNEPVDRKLRYPNPASKSLDHIVPLSRGGGHTLANVRCSHLKCNVDRSNRLD